MGNRLLNRRIRFALSICIASAMLVSISVSSDAAGSGGASESIESAEASAMQLMKTEGEVSVLNAAGKNISIIDHMKLYNGYRTSTEESSYGWISLDSEKLAKLDAVSETEVRKKGKQLEILLKSGNLFFDVSEPLEEEETLNIRTSTMVMGIRGTSGWVKVIDRWRTRVYLLEGTVVCYVTDPVTGQIKSTTLSAGEMAEFVVYEEGQRQDEERCDILRQGFTEEDIDGFVLVELKENEPLRGKIEKASGLDTGSAANGAEERLSADQKQMKDAMDHIREEYGKQENHISRDPVWVKGRETAEMPETEEEGEIPERVRNPERGGGMGSNDPGTPPGGGGGVPDGTSNGIADPSEPGGESGGGSSGGNSGGVQDPVEVHSVTLTDGTDSTSAENLNNLLNSPDVGEIVVKKNPNPNKTWYQPTDTPGEWIDDPSVVNVDSDITIPAGKTLTLEEDVDMTIEAGNTVTIDGTLNVGGMMTNNGTIIVTGS